jgi:sec-independent protein translocase protein TatB
VFGLSFEKLLLIMLVAGLIVGPQRLPLYAEKLAHLVRTIRDLTDTAKTRATAELSPDFDHAKWEKFDPRRYDPRRIIQDTLADAPALATPPVHNEQPSYVEKADTTDTHQATTPPPIAKGGWQEALLARVVTKPSNTLNPAVATGIPAWEPSSTTPTHNDSYN